MSTGQAGRGVDLGAARRLADSGCRCRPGGSAGKWSAERFMVLGHGSTEPYHHDFDIEQPTELIACERNLASFVDMETRTAMFRQLCLVLLATRRGYPPS